MGTLQGQITDELGVNPEIDPREEIVRRVGFLKDYLLKTDAKGYVLGISGGQDSALAGRLAQMAVEQVRRETGAHVTFIAMRLPYGMQHDEADAQSALEFIDPDKTMVVDVKAAVDASALAFQNATGDAMTDFIKGNTKARERMKVQYDVAAHYGLLVVGTDHAAEAVTGFFTKYGDGGCDVIPLAGLTKRQGKALLQEMNAPESIYTKTPTADLLDGRPGQPDEAELGLKYEEIDSYLEGRDVGEAVARKIEARYNATRHKRTVPVSPHDTWWNV